MDTIQNIDIPRENIITANQPQSHQPFPKLSLKVIIIIILAIVGLFLILVTSFLNQTNHQSLPVDHSQPNQSDTSPSPNSPNPIYEQLNQLKQNLNSGIQIPTLNVDDKITF